MDIKVSKKTKITQFKTATLAHDNVRIFQGGRSKMPTLLSHGKRTTAFYTEDSKLYITPKEYVLLGKGIKLNRSLNKWDCLSSRVVNEYKNYQPSQSGLLYRALKRRSKSIVEDASEASQSLVGQFSMVRLWNLSIVGAILLGMFSMTMIYKYLGQGAAAEEAARIQSGTSASAVLGEESSFTEMEKSIEQELYGLSEISDEEKLEEEIRKMVKGYPIEDMAAYIAQKDRKVAAFIVAIAKKESNWGIHVPVLNGQDCYNYWGYRGQRALMGTGGHTCFNSRKDAVDTVAKRIATLIEKEQLDTPAEMVVWKCGSSCAATGGQAAANKWISDVNKYYGMLND